MAGGRPVTQLSSSADTKVLTLVAGTNIAVSSTAVPLVSAGTELYVTEAIIQAKVTNSGNVFIGPSTVAATGANGVCLGPKDFLKVYNQKLQDLFVNGVNVGDGVAITYWISNVE